MTCETCGQVHTRCQGHRKRIGGPCMAWPPAGAPHCRMHAGRAHQDVMAELEVRRTAQRLMPASLAPRPIEDPLTALALLAGEVVAVKTAFGQIVDNLAGLVEQPGGEARYRKHLELYGEYLDRAKGVLEAVARLRIDERLAVITESQARQLETVLVLVLERFGLDGRSDDVRVVVGEVLEELAR